MKNNKKELERRHLKAVAAERKLYDQLKRIQDREIELNNKNLVGKTFVFRNCYSCPSEESDYWSVFVDIVRSHETNLIIEQFEVDKNGKVEISQMEVSPLIFTSMRTAYEEIPRNDFEEGKKKVLEKMGLVSND
jgi:hypothetical protein